VGTPLKVAFVERGEGEEKHTYLAFEAETGDLTIGTIDL